MMMSNLRLIAAIMVALFAVGLEVEAGTTWSAIWKIGETLRTEMRGSLPKVDQADAEKAFSFAKKLIIGLGKEYAKAGQELVTAWDAVLHHPDQCNEFSLGYVARIDECYPWSSESMATLTEATQKYASKCLTPSYIENKIESETRSSGCFSISCFKTKEVKFIDDQLIADYLLDNPEDGRFMTIDGFRASKAVARAVLRDRKRNIKGLKKQHYVHAYLKEYLFEPCFNYEKALRSVMGDLIGASLFLEGRYEKLIPSLDKNSQDVIFRYHLCKEISVFKQATEISSQVASELKSLTARD